VLNLVTPANAGVQNILRRLDTGFRRYDGKANFSTFYEFVKMNAQKIVTPVKPGAQSFFN